jgi:NAD(P)-dependent dehydrogenase (short-subunit alcohol dehydrogenase family)
LRRIHVLAIDCSAKRTLVTGAGQGVGREVARYLARAGAMVVEGDRALASVEAHVRVSRTTPTEVVDAKRITVAGGLDLDNLGAEVDEQRRAVAAWAAG